MKLDLKAIRDLAHDCVTMTLHGPIPMQTVAKLATGVMELYDENERLKKPGWLNDDVELLTRNEVKVIISVVTQNLDTSKAIERHGVSKDDLIKLGEMALKSLGGDEAYEMPGGKEVTMDPVQAAEAWAKESRELATRVRELEARIGAMR